MRTQRVVFGLVGIVAALSAQPISAQEKSKKIPKLWTRVPYADAIVLGKVTAIDEKTVEAKAVPDGGGNATFTIATVSVSRVIHGPDDKEIKVGFVRVAEDPKDPDHQNLRKDRECCFVLYKHPDQPFYVYHDHRVDIFDSNHPWYERRIKVIEKCYDLMKDPKTVLKESKSDLDKLLCACLMIHRYRNPKIGSKTEPIDEEESRLILWTLSEADWGKELDINLAVNPQPAFLLLGLTEKDGWKPGGDVRSAAETWLIDHRDTYRIQRFVPDKK
jgi:hypothetical protein